MAIHNLTDGEFSKILEQHLRSSCPIDTTELLFAQESVLERMEEAFGSAGPQVFIYADRGFGKTSVAHTARYAFNRADSEPVYVTGVPGSLQQSPRTLQSKSQREQTFERIKRPRHSVSHGTRPISARRQSRVRERLRV
jgi:hypothetical protein